MVLAPMSSDLPHLSGRVGTCTLGGGGARVTGSCLIGLISAAGVGQSPQLPTGVETDSPAHSPAPRLRTAGAATGQRAVFQPFRASHLPH